MIMIIIMSPSWLPYIVLGPTSHLLGILTNHRTINGLLYHSWGQNGFPGQEEPQLNHILHVVLFLWEDNFITALSFIKKKLIFKYCPTCPTFSNNFSSAFMLS